MTHTTKHTPGPWVVDTASISGDRIVKGASDQTIAQLHWHTASDANATLIAAAPAMYEALQAMLNGILFTRGASMSEDRWQTLTAIARTALSQAEGRDK